MADKTFLTKAVVSVVISAGLVALAMSGPKYNIIIKDESGTVQVVYNETETPEAANANNVVTAEQWKELFPEEYNSYVANGNNTYRVSYIEEDPYITNVYEGYGFAKDYTSAIAHNYTLEDVANTERPHALANCLTCKTADFTALVNTLGVQAYSMEFDEAYSMVSENVGCYNCHENNLGNGTDAGLTATHDYTVEKLTDDGIDAKTLVCGQCHIEYYFHSDTKQADTPYDTVEGMSPDAILEYYNEIGFSDWVQESTGTGLLKAQHPEMETTLGEGNKHAALGLTCADCHMAKTVSEDGVAYTSHELVSPLESEEILNKCASCHGNTDMAAKVAEIQEATTAREEEVGMALSDLNDKLTEAVASNMYTEDELNELRDLYRSAQWYWDFDYVENSEGAHNSTLANYCLDTSMDYIEQANALFK